MKLDKHLKILLPILGFLALFGHLNDYSLRQEEPRRALIALELAIGDNPMQPTVHGLNYYRKPPLYNWFIAASHWLTGSTSEFATRLPATISYIMLGLLLYLFVARYEGKSKALLSCFFLFSFVDLTAYYGRLAEMDLFYSLLSFPLIVLPWLALRSKKYWIFYLLPPFIAGIGFLSKGLPSLGFLGISMVTAILIEGDYKRFYDPRVVLSFVFLAIPLLAFFYPQYIEGKLEKSLDIIFSESASRTTGKAFGSRFGHLFWYLLQVLKGTLPVCLLFVFFKKSIIKNPFYKGLAILFVANLALYLLSPGARLRYAYPLFPILAIFLAEIAIGLKENVLSKIHIGLRWLIGVVLSIQIGAFIYFKMVDLVLIASMLILGFILIQAIRQKSSPWPLLLAIVFSLRIGVDFANVIPEFVAKSRTNNEKLQAHAMLEKYLGQTIYINIEQELYYTFSYEYTRLSNEIFRHNFDFSDPKALYIIPTLEMNDKLIEVEKLQMGNDTGYSLVKIAAR